MSMKTFFANNACLPVRMYLNQFIIKEYGKMLKLEIDPVKQTMSLEVLLKGEVEPLHVSVGRYACVAANGDSRLTLHDVTTSREWINALIQGLHPNGLSVPLNGTVATLANKVM